MKPGTRILLNPTVPEKGHPVIAYLDSVTCSSPQPASCCLPLPCAFAFPDLGQGLTASACVQRLAPVHESVLGRLQRSPPCMHTPLNLPWMLLLLCGLLAGASAMSPPAWLPHSHRVSASAFGSFPGSLLGLTYPPQHSHSTLAATAV